MTELELRVAIVAMRRTCSTEDIIELVHIGRFSRVGFRQRDTSRLLSDVVLARCLRGLSFPDFPSAAIPLRRQRARCWSQSLMVLHENHGLYINQGMGSEFPHRIVHDLVCRSVLQRTVAVYCNLLHRVAIC